MSITTYWSPNQATISQVETYTFLAPNGVGNTYNATINGKTVTYTSVSGDTAASVATALFNLLSQTTSVPAELTEVTFTNPSSGVLVATASTPGTPFANVTVNGVSGQGLVLSTGNGLSNGIATAHTQANQSPSDVNDPQNWLRVNLGNTPPSTTRSLPQNTDDVVVAASSAPMSWNLDRLSAVQFNTYNRYQSMSGGIGLPDTNDSGYTEWRATRFRFLGPQGSVPAGGLAVVLGADIDGLGGSGPGTERYDLQSSQYTLTAANSSASAVDVVGQHTSNTFTAMPGSSVSVAASTGTKSNLGSSTVETGASATIGPNVTWTAGSTLTVLGGSAVVNAAPATIDARNGARVTFNTDALTYATILGQGNCAFTFNAGGIITTYTVSTGCTLDKSNDARSLTITNSTIDGDSCTILDPLNSITFTNATSVKQQVSTGPIQFTGTRTMKVT